MIRLPGAGLLVLLLAGCASLPTPGPLPSDPAAALRAQVTDWQLHGRVSLTRGEQGWHAGLDWEQRSDAYQLQVSGPLGQGALRLTGDADRVVLEDADGRRYAATDPESLLLAVTGWELPVSGLRDWVRALPVAGVPAEVRLDDSGRVARIAQAGWTIEYLRFAAVDGMQWPTRMRLVRDDLALRVVVDSWSLDRPQPESP